MPVYRCNPIGTQMFVATQHRVWPLDHDRADTAEAFTRQALPLTARAQHIHDRLEHQPWGLRRAPAARLCTREL